MKISYLIILPLILIVILLFVFLTMQKLNSSKIFEYEDLLKSLQAKNNILEGENNKLKIKIEETEDNTGYIASSNRCKKTSRIWNSLPEALRKRTFDERYNRSSSSTYQITPLIWSPDCSKLPFILELVGRGTGAYTNEDYKPRGIYIYDDSTNQVSLIKLHSGDIDYEGFSTNIWSGENLYIFEENRDGQKSQSTKLRFEYNTFTKQLQLHKDLFLE